MALHRKCQKSIALNVAITDAVVALRISIIRLIPVLRLFLSLTN